jgi:hypothetical protein
LKFEKDQDLQELNKTQNSKTSKVGEGGRVQQRKWNLWVLVSKKGKILKVQAGT